jgi:hypothetical protein
MENKKESIKIDLTSRKVEKIIKTTAKCLKDITLYDNDVFEGDKTYNVLIEIKGDILTSCFSEYVYVDSKRIIAEDFFKNFELV